MRRLILTALLIAFSCTSPQAVVMPPQSPDNPYKQKPPTIADRQPLALEQLRKLKPRITELLSHLGSSDFKTREKAKAGFLEIGLPSVPALEEAAKSRDPQVAHLAAKLVERLRPKIERLITITERISIFSWHLQQKLGLPETAKPPARNKLSEYVRFIRKRFDVNVLIHPDLQKSNPLIEIGTSKASLAELLKRIAEKLNAVWVARFGVLCLSDPVTAFELSKASVLTEVNPGNRAILKKLAGKLISLSVTNTNLKLSDIIDFASELSSIKFTIDEDVKDNSTIHNFEVNRISLYETLSFSLFILDLKGTLKNDKLVIQRADYSSLSSSFKADHNRLREFNDAWKNLK